MKHYSILTLVLLGALSLGCTKIPELVGDDETTVIPGDLVIPGSTGDPVTLTTTVSLGGNPESKALAAAGVKTFAVNDQIAVIYKNTGGKTVKALSSALVAEDIVGDGRMAIITVTLTDPAPSGAVRYIYPAAMAKETIKDDAAMDDESTIDFSRLATQDGTLASLASGLDLAVYDGNLTAEAALPAIAPLANPLCIGEFTIKNTDGTSDLTPTLTGLWVSDGTNNYAVSRTAAEGPIYVAMCPVASSATITFAAQTASTYYEREVTGKPLAAGKMYPVGVKMTQTHTVNLARLCNKYEAQNGETLTGKLALCKQISIADGATVTLNDVDINGDDTFTTGEFPGITCNGDATLTLEGTNTVRGCKNGFPGIYPAGSKTLTINGTGKLFAYSKGSQAAGIGSGYYSNNASCGNIVIESGEITAKCTSTEGAGIGCGSRNGVKIKCGNITITGGTVIAQGGSRAAGIGTGHAGNISNAKTINQCGNITITGGTVTATGGALAAGIGLGSSSGGNKASNICGTITINGSHVTAIRGSDAPYCIGKGAFGAGEYILTCGTITIGGDYKGTEGVNPDPNGNTYVYQP